MSKYDVIKDFDWTSVPRGSAYRKTAPRVWIRSYILNSSNVLTAYEGYKAVFANLGGSADSFYNDMYSKTTTIDDDFNFPFFTDEVRSFNNTFGDTFQNGAGSGPAIASSLNEVIKTALGTAFDAANLLVGEVGAAKNGFNNGDTALDKALNGMANIAANKSSPGTYIETPQFYQYDKSDNDLSISFALFNTINDDSLEKNHDLITRLTYINRPNRKNSISVNPPRIYQIKVPGHRFIRWAYCSSFSVEFLGSRRLLQGKIQPEGFKINMSFKSLTMEHAGFLKKT